MNRSHRHGAGSGCLGTMEVKSKVRGARAGRSGQLDGDWGRGLVGMKGTDWGLGEARGWPGPALGAARGLESVGDAVVGFVGRRKWVMNLLRRGRGWGHRVCPCSR